MGDLFRPLARNGMLLLRNVRPADGNVIDCVAANGLDRPVNRRTINSVEPKRENGICNPSKLCYSWMEMGLLSIGRPPVDLGMCIAIFPSGFGFSKLSRMGIIILYSNSRFSMVIIILHSKHIF